MILILKTPASLAADRNSYLHRLKANTEAMLDLRIFYKIAVVFVALASLAEGKVPFLVSKLSEFTRLSSLIRKLHRRSKLLLTVHIQWLFLS